MVQFPGFQVLENDHIQEIHLNPAVKMGVEQSLPTFACDSTHSDPPITMYYTDLLQ